MPDRCRIVAAPYGHRIRLDFRGEFHIETSEDCDYDYLQVVDGPFSYSPVVGRYCGRRHPPLIESTGRYLWLRFQSDDSIEYVGFHIVYEFIPVAADHHDDFPGIQVHSVISLCAGVARRAASATPARYYNFS